MMQPARTKYRKQMKGRHKGKAYRGGDLAFRPGLHVGLCG